MPGQFRNTRTHIFQNQTIINNNVNYCNHGSYQYYDDSCCGGKQKMSWFDWTMLGGMGLNLLGNIFSLFGGGADNTQTPVMDQNARQNLERDLDALKTQFKEANLSYLSDGTILCDGEKYKSIDEVINALKVKYNNPNSNSATQNGAGAQKATSQSTTKPSPQNEVQFKISLFNDTRTEIQTSSSEISAFTSLADNSQPYTIDTSKDLTITAVVDKGNNTQKTDNLVIEKDMLTNIMNDTSGNPIKLSNTKFKGKDVKAQKLGNS